MDAQLDTVPKDLASYLGAMVGWLKQIPLKQNPSKVEILFLCLGQRGLDREIQLPNPDGYS